MLARKEERKFSGFLVCWFAKLHDIAPTKKLANQKTKKLAIANL
jgi:hypothetical protein